MQIVANNLSYSYGDKIHGKEVYALKNVCLTIDDGDFFGIIGHTGSGKSTFLSLLNGLYRIGKNKGSLTVGNFDLADKKCDLQLLRSKIGVVFQYPEYQLFAETCFDDIAFGLKNFSPNLSPDEVNRKVMDAMELVGLPFSEFKDKSPFELSGGQKRRVAIAGVIVSRPEVLILDEPAVGLDPKGKREFISLIKSLHNDFVKTVIIVSHDMNLISENCNKVAVFGGGTVKAVGSPKDVFLNPDILSDTGLIPPTVATIYSELIKSGKAFDIPDLTIDGFIDAYCNHLKKGVKV